MAAIAKLNIVLLTFFFQMLSLLLCLASQPFGKTTMVGFIVLIKGSQPQGPRNRPSVSHPGSLGPGPPPESSPGPFPSHPCRLVGTTVSPGCLAHSCPPRPPVCSKGRGTHSSRVVHPSPEASAGTDSETPKQDTNGGSHSPVLPPIRLPTSGLKMNKPIRKPPLFPWESFSSVV